MTMLADYDAAVTALQTFKTNALTTPMPADLGERLVAIADAALAELENNPRLRARLAAQGL